MAWVIDNSHTTIGFSVKHMMITTVRGVFHKFNGTLQLDPQNPQNSVIEGEVEAASIDTREEKRDAHLRSADFFDVENHPTLKLKSNRVEVVDADHYKLYADITIRGVTREIVFNVNNEGLQKSPWGTEVWGLTAEAALNRKDFGLNWNVALEAGGWLVGEQVKINIELEVIKQPETVTAAAN